MAESSDIRAGRAYVEIGANSKEAEQKLKEMQSRLDVLKKGLGEDSKFGGVFKILAGTGAVAGLALAGRLLSEVTAKAVEMRDAFADGSKSAAEVADELARSVPVFGEIYKAGRDIRELFSGSQAETNKILEDAKRLDSVYEDQKKSVKEIHDYHKRTADIVRQLDNERERVGQEGPMRDAIMARQQADDIRREALERRDEKHKSADANYAESTTSKLAYDADSKELVETNPYTRLKNERDAAQKRMLESRASVDSLIDDGYTDQAAITKKAYLDPDAATYDQAQSDVDAETARLIRKRDAAKREADDGLNATLKSNAAVGRAKVSEAFNDWIAKLSEGVKKKLKEVAEKETKEHEAWQKAATDRWLDDDKALRERAKDARESAMSPQDKFRAKQDDLDDLLGAGAIDSDVYVGAVKAAEKDRDKELAAELDSAMKKSFAASTFNGTLADQALGGGASSVELQAARDTAKIKESTGRMAQIMEQLINQNAGGSAVFGH